MCRVFKYGSETWTMKINKKNILKVSRCNRTKKSENKLDRKSRNENVKKKNRRGRGVSWRRTRRERNHRFCTISGRVSSATSYGEENRREKRNRKNVVRILSNLKEGNSYQQMAHKTDSQKKKELVYIDLHLLEPVWYSSKTVSAY